MTTVEILFRLSGQPTETAAFALANAREVYGIRRLSFDRTENTLLVEYDATRLNAAIVTQLVRRSGLELIEELPAPEPIVVTEAPAAAPVVETKPGSVVSPSPQTLPPPTRPAASSPAASSPAVPAPPGSPAPPAPLP
jgi:hypothetical protein